MVLQLQTEGSRELNRTNLEIESALNHLIAQFRQIDKKYGLMVGREIDEMYHDRVELMNYSYDFLEQSNQELDLS